MFIAEKIISCYRSVGYMVLETKLAISKPKCSQKLEHRVYARYPEGRNGNVESIGHAVVAFGCRTVWLLQSSRSAEGR
jgi:hypothetical protein